MANARQRELIHQLRQMGNRGFQSFEGAPGFQQNFDGPTRERAANIVGGNGRGSVMPIMDPGMPNTAPTPGNVATAAQFTIQVKRLTATIAAPLPVMLFDPIDRANGYRQALQSRLPAGVTITSAEGGEATGKPDSFQFVFASGANTDTVVVSCTTAPYPSFLDALVTDMFDLTKIRVSLSDPSQVVQFQQELLFKSKSMFGLGTENPVVPENFRSPQQYQAGIVDVDVNAKFDKQTGIIVPIIPVANLQVSVNCYASRFYQQSARFW